MDLLCTNCGEPWDLNHVLHDEPASFTRNGCLISHCPVCPQCAPILSDERREYLAIAAEMARLYGEDVDGFACWLEDHPQHVVTGSAVAAIPSDEERFTLGRVLATPGALAALIEAKQNPLEFLIRHVRGDWGDVCDADALENDDSLKEGRRLLSAYHTKTGVKLWVITEWDRSVTTILLPEEY